MKTERYVIPVMIPADYFIYNGVFTHTDGSEEVLDLEERGWADPLRIEDTIRFALIPKNPDSTFPTVIVNIPDEAKMVFKSRVFGKAMISGDGESGPLFRCYALGYKLGPTESLVWVLPTGDIEFGPEPKVAEELVRVL